MDLGGGGGGGGVWGEGGQPAEEAEGEVEREVSTDLKPLELEKEEEEGGEVE